ncbi:hypothetical protein HOLleu_39034 [Holothuria leucospilota]|uniref:Uncharacterized protein n=1 Tax=Holothuria leucospilota TaxID=206669 RepID=A0A9Q0YG03_HOLLE|nr:hypothetical protein HOLleu_39034 [Holothuria leucospilota]
MALRTHDGSTMVKATLRKSSKHLTPVEKWLSLEQNSFRRRNRVHSLNHKETVQLSSRYHVFEQNRSRRMRDILRTKDQMKLTLIDIDHTRQRLRGICDFEKRLREGTNSPVFLKEHMKLQRKGEELTLLQNKLHGPNSMIIANQLKEELKAIAYRVEEDSNPGISKGVTGPYDVQLDETSLSKEMELPLIDDDVAGETGGSGGKTDVGGSHKDGNTSPSQDQVMYDGENSDEKDPVSGAQKFSEEFGDVTTSSQLDKHLHTLSRSDSFFPITSSISPKKDELPPLKFKNRQKHCHFVVHRSHRPKQSLYHPTHSALKRAKHAQKRVAELGEKTREDMRKDGVTRKRKETNSPSDSLKGIQQAETIARLQVAKKGISLPDIKTATEHRKQTPRAQTSDSTIQLPKLKVDRDLLSELKRQRYKHKHQSESFPKLP